MSDLNDILTPGQGNGGKERLSEDKLMAYLDGKLSAAEQHEVELWLADEGMESDALEGLRELAHEDTRHSVNMLNRNLRKTIFSKKRERRQLKPDQFTWVAILITLLLVVLAYIVIRKIMAQ